MDRKPDLNPSARRLTDVVTGVAERQLTLSTPCEGRTVSQLLAHIHGLTAAFHASAAKEFGPLTDTNPDSSGWGEAPAAWRAEIRARAEALGEAWSRPEAWTGTTRAGGVELPAELMGLVALGELTFHGWDLATATGQEFAVDPETVAALAGYVAGFDPAGTPGIFGPAVETSADSSDFERVLARTGRDPHWHSPASS